MVQWRHNNWNVPVTHWQCTVMKPQRIPERINCGETNLQIATHLWYSGTYFKLICDIYISITVHCQYHDWYCNKKHYSLTIDLSILLCLIETTTCIAARIWIACLIDGLLPIFSMEVHILHSLGHTYFLILQTRKSLMQIKLPG